MEWDGGSRKTVIPKDSPKTFLFQVSFLGTSQHAAPVSPSPRVRTGVAGGRFTGSSRGHAKGLPMVFSGLKGGARAQSQTTNGCDKTRALHGTLQSHQTGLGEILNRWPRVSRRDTTPRGNETLTLRENTPQGSGVHPTDIQMEAWRAQRGGAGQKHPRAS